MCCFNTREVKRSRACLALQIMMLISLSRVPSLGMTLSKYLKSSTDLSSVPSMEIKGGRAVEAVTYCTKTSVLHRLLVKAKIQEASVNFLVMS